MEHHHVRWENQLFLWWFSIAMSNYQRVGGSVPLALAFLTFPSAWSLRYNELHLGSASCSLSTHPIIAGCLGGFAVNHSHFSWISISFWRGSTCGTWEINGARSFHPVPSSPCSATGYQCLWRSTLPNFLRNERTIEGWLPRSMWKPVADQDDSLPWKNMIYSTSFSQLQASK